MLSIFFLSFWRVKCSFSWIFSVVMSSNICSTRDSRFALRLRACVSNADLSFIFYGFGLLLHIEYNGRTIYECAPCRFVLLPAALTVHERLKCKELPSASETRIQFAAAVRQWAMPP